ncbi:hypothetical protein, partial [Pseudomonas sp. NFACC23-1]|uniref:hypothetical protein n=1 Tax=Pseudomonas sp. NFACC23-1 TaxID=1566190 RepID=UPI001C4689B7
HLLSLQLISIADQFTIFGVWLAPMGFIPAGLRSSPNGGRIPTEKPLRRRARAGFLAPNPGHYESLFILPPQRLHQATNPCAIAYNYARIRPLVRLAHGFYRFPATAHQWSGLVAR